MASNSSISNIIREIMEKNLPYIRHYRKLDLQFTTVQECYKFYRESEKNDMITKIRIKGSNDLDSILGTYLRINPDLQSPTMYHNMLCQEHVRAMITKYRTGSHGLRIQSGRKDGVLRAERKCICNKDIQTINHVLFECEITENITSLIEQRNITRFFNIDNYNHIGSILESVEKILNLS